jgi:predicted DNA-binding protein (MmcQ/YjbR family)
VNRQRVLDACANRPASTEEYPFGDDVAVFKVGGKVFAMISLDGEPGRVTLKCDPDWALELRAEYPAVQPGYHTNKRHWNTVTLDGTVASTDIDDMIRHSYDIVVAGLTKQQRAQLT